MTSHSFSKEDVLAGAEQLDFPSSVVEFFQGYLGQPVWGFPEPLRTELRSKFGKHITDSDVTSYVMYPKVFC